MQICGAGSRPAHPCHTGSGCPPVSLLVNRPAPSSPKENDVLAKNFFMLCSLYEQHLANQVHYGRCAAGRQLHQVIWAHKPQGTRCVSHG